MSLRELREALPGAQGPATLPYDIFFSIIDILAARAEKETEVIHHYITIADKTASGFNISDQVDFAEHDGLVPQRRRLDLIRSLIQIESKTRRHILATTFRPVEMVSSSFFPDHEIFTAVGWICPNKDRFFPWIGERAWIPRLTASLRNPTPELRAPSSSTPSAASAFSRYRPCTVSRRSNKPRNTALPITKASVPELAMWVKLVGKPAFQPRWPELERRGIRVFVHENYDDATVHLDVLELVNTPQGLRMKFLDPEGKRYETHVADDPYEERPCNFVMLPLEGVMTMLTQQTTVSNDTGFRRWHLSNETFLDVIDVLVLGAEESAAPLCLTLSSKDGQLKVEGNRLVFKDNDVVRSQKQRFQQLRLALQICRRTRGMAQRRFPPVEISVPGWSMVGWALPTLDRFIPLGDGFCWEPIRIAASLGEEFTRCLGILEYVPFDMFKGGNAEEKFETILSLPNLSIIRVIIGFRVELPSWTLGRPHDHGEKLWMERSTFLDEEMRDLANGQVFKKFLEEAEKRGVAVLASEQGRVGKRDVQIFCEGGSVRMRMSNPVCTCYN
ncbi:hypothetical protein CMUS01_05225 [Colletotrichum musicola]|uniref:Uncharacterized protein n=1 Tax=Colletotrichum musicola TaxID=2175873 RepID=A0A8H6NLK3_9PEZI|nr:hypothetical protein CMUS01_05225 [Colletotrichum musicola]